MSGSLLSLWGLGCRERTTRQTRMLQPQTRNWKLLIKTYCPRPRLRRAARDAAAAASLVSLWRSTWSMGTLFRCRSGRICPDDGVDTEVRAAPAMQSSMAVLSVHGAGPASHVDALALVYDCLP